MGAMPDYFPIKQKDYSRFRKIYLVMKRSSLQGERMAAKEAAKRIAQSYGLSLDEMIIETHPEIYGTKLSKEENKAQQSAIFEVWASSASRMMSQSEAREKYRFNMALREARARGLDAKEKDQQKKATSHRPRFSYYGKNPKQFSQKDHFRLVSGLLRDGVPIHRVAEIADSSLNDVTKIYLQIRTAKQVV